MQADPIRDDEDDPGEIPEPPSLRWLRRLVTVLTLVLIFGMLAMVAVFVIQLGRIDQTLSPMPPISADRFALPAGETISTLGQSGGRVLIVTTDIAGQERLRSFDAETGKSLSTSLIERD